MKSQHIALTLLVGIMTVMFIIGLVAFQGVKEADKAITASADRFAGSEMVWVMDKLSAQGVCIDYTQEEVKTLYTGKKVEERKVYQALLDDKWKCK